MSRRVRIEIVGRNEFWRKAVFVEWEHQFPARGLTPAADGRFLIPADWLEDLQRVAGQCFSRVLLAPDDVGRRRLLRGLFGGGERE